MAVALVPELKTGLRQLACVGRRLPALRSGAQAFASFPTTSHEAASSAAVVRLAFAPPTRLGLCLGAAAAAAWLAAAPAGGASQSASCEESHSAAEQPEGREQTAAERQADQARLHVVLDIDETLVHSQQVHPSMLYLQSRLGRRQNQKDDVFSLMLSEGIAIQVSKRPGLEDFLRWLQKRGYQVSLYTAGTRKYVEALLPRLDPEGIVSQCLSREDCVPAPGLPNVYLKDLRRVVTTSTAPDGSKTTEPADLARTVLVDNNPLSFAMQPENGILVRDWLGGTPEELPDDSEFERVKALLLQLEHSAPARDVREVLPMFQKLEIRKLLAHLGSKLPFSSL